MKILYSALTVFALLAAAPAAAEPIPFEAVTCPFENMLADQKMLDAAANTDGKYGLSADLEAAILSAIGICTGANGWSGDVSKFSLELTRMAMMVTELEDTLSAAGIMPDDYGPLLDDLSDEDLSAFAADTSNTSVKAKALAKLAAADKKAVATHSEILIQFLQGDAKGRLMGKQVAME